MASASSMPSRLFMKNVVPSADLSLHGGRHRRVRVAQQHRAGADQEIDILAPGLVPDPAAASLADDEVGRHVAERPARQHAVCPLQQCRL